ncbi:NAD(P)H-binding protein [Rhizobium laguerreae]
MQIGVSGAGGKLGSVVVSELLARGGGHGIVGISRSPEKLEGGFDKREGDYDRPEGLAQAYQGLDQLLIIPSADLRPGIRGVQMKAAIDAALKAGVGQIFLVSAAGTREAAVPALGEILLDGGAGAGQKRFALDHPADELLCRSHAGGDHHVEGSRRPCRPR